MLIDSGFTIATNQVPCSVLDLRVQRGRLNDLCLENGVGLLCYGTLMGGFLSEKWVGQPEPKDVNELNWSLRKYLRFIWAAGGWGAYQGVLGALQGVAQKHGVPISAVATRYVLDIPSVKGVIVGSRLGANSEAYVASNLKAFAFSLDDKDRRAIAKAQEALKDLPGDSGDEYRRPPYLTAAGNLSDHLEETDRSRQVSEAIANGQRVEYSSGSKWEPIAVRTHQTYTIKSQEGYRANFPKRDIAVQYASVTPSMCLARRQTRRSPSSQTSEAPRQQVKQSGSWISSRMH